MTISEIIFFLLGLIIGGLVIYFMRPKQTPSLENDRELEKENIALKKDVEHLRERIEKSIEEFSKQREREQVLQDEKLAITGQLHERSNQVHNLEEKLLQQKGELEKLQEQFTKEFKLVANAILKQNSEEFSKAHQKELDAILQPLKEKIQHFENKVEERYIKNRDERLSLQHQIKNLTELNSALNLQAKNLTEALKGESKTQGNWGEMVLERILESSGLIKGEEYETQYSDYNAENKRIQPDVIIKLPDNKHIIIDAKVSLTAYERLVNEPEEETKAAHLKAHIQSVRTHVQQLSERNYSSGQKLHSPDFVLLFMPIEPSFTLAAQEDESLFSFAWDKKIVIVSPTTLLATLRTVASVWKQERQNKNAEKIARKAGLLYDKFKGFVDDMKKIEKGISSAQSAYNDAFNKLSSGNGNLLRKVEDIRELGAITNKSIPRELIEDIDDQD